MSEDTEAVDTSCECCASCGCGIAEIDDVKLKDCDGCGLARYCSDACRELHRPDHAGKCRKRAAELRDEMEDKKMVCASCGTGGVATPVIPQSKDCPYKIIFSVFCSAECQRDHMQKLHKKVCEERAQRDELLFKQPEGTHLGDCPLCSLPLPNDHNKWGLYTCCYKRICKGCYYANRKREAERGPQRKCPFCRTGLAKTKEERNKQSMMRVEANDPLALYFMGQKKYEGDYKCAFEYWTRAVSLGNVEAHYRLGVLHRDGKGVEKDEKRAVWHLEEAAIAGHPGARYSLGLFEGGMKGRYSRAMKHFIIAAKLGHDMSLNEVKEAYKAGRVSKEDFAATLRGHHAAIEATKSPQREKAATFKRAGI